MRGGRTNSAAGESGIDVDGLDDGDYIDDIRGDTPFLSPVEKIPETDVLQKGNRRTLRISIPLLQILKLSKFRTISELQLYEITSQLRIIRPVCIDTI